MSHSPRIGRPRTLAPDTIERIAKERAAGSSLRAIARSLNEDGVATAQGGRCWHATTVGEVLARYVTVGGSGA